MENKGKQFKGSGIKKYIKEDWEDDLGEEKEDVVEYVISFEPGEYYDEYHGEFITEDKDEADDLFDEIKEEHKLDQVSQYIEKTWEWDRVNEEYYETDVDVYFNAGDELEFYGESKKTEGYSLGDDKESFDVYKHTAEFLNKVGKELEELGWKFNKEKGKFEKEDITIDMEAIQDNVNDLYIGSNKLKLSNLARDYSSYEDIGEDTGIIYYVSTKAGDYEARQLASKINSCEKYDEYNESKKITEDVENIDKLKVDIQEPYNTIDLSNLDLDNLYDDIIEKAINETKLGYFDKFPEGTITLDSLWDICTDRTIYR